MEWVAEILFSLDVCLCRADRSVRLVGNTIEMTDAADSKFGKHVSGDNPIMIRKKISQKGCGHGYATPIFLVLKC